MRRGELAFQADYAVPSTSRTLLPRTTPTRPIRHYAPLPVPKPAPTPDLKTLADAANDAAKREATQWFFLVTLMVYLAVAVGSTTYRVLFLESPVQLPIFNVQVPLVGFYWLAPALLVVMHFYLLAQLQVMADKVQAVLDAAGITVNALAVATAGQVTRAGEPLAETYRREVIGGPGAFVATAEDRRDIARALRAKLVREIA